MKGFAMPDSAVPHLSAAARLVAGALAEVHETTVVVLADAAGVSKSTVAKTLSLLEDSGAATRIVRETDGIREADLWSPTSALASLLAGAPTTIPSWRTRAPCRRSSSTPPVSVR